MPPLIPGRKVVDILPGVGIIGVPEPIEECRGQVIADRPGGFQGVMPDRFQEVGLARPGLADKHQHPRTLPVGKSSGRGQHFVGPRTA